MVQKLHCMGPHSPDTSALPPHNCISVSTFYFPKQSMQQGKKKIFLQCFFFKTKINDSQTANKCYVSSAQSCLFSWGNLSCICVLALDKTQGEFSRQRLCSLCLQPAVQLRETFS